MKRITIVLLLFLLTGMVFAESNVKKVEKNPSDNGTYTIKVSATTQRNAPTNVTDNNETSELSYDESDVEVNEPDNNHDRYDYNSRDNNETDDRNSGSFDIDEDIAEQSSRNIEWERSIERDMESDRLNEHDEDQHD